MNVTTPFADPFAWSQRPYGRVFNNLTIPNTKEGRLEIAEILGSDLMATAAKSGAKTAIFDSRNQWYALHDTPVCWKHPGLEDRDLIAEIIDAGHELGIQYVPYIPVDCDQRAFEEHPEWRNVDFGGLIVDQSFPRVCENSPFADYMAGYLIDLLQRYDIQGLWFDGLGVNSGCYCSYCRDGFRTAAGQEAPRSAGDLEIWNLWLDYKKAATQRVFETFARAARSVRPGIPIHTAWLSDVRGSSQTWVEGFWKWPTPFLQLMRSETEMVGEFYVETAQYSPSYHIALTEAELRDRAMIAISNGAVPTFTMMANPASTRAIHQEVEVRAPWLIGSDPAPYVAVVYSEKSKQLCERDQWKDGPDFTLYGTVMPLLEEKIPETCITDRNLELDDLSKFAVIVLPDIGIISDTVASKLKAFVAAGGGLVANYRTSLHGPDGSQLSDFRLADLFGVHFRGTMPNETVLEPWSATNIGLEQANGVLCKYLIASDHEIVNDPLIRGSRAVEVVPAYRRGEPKGYDIPYPGPMFRVEADNGVDAVLSEAFQEPGVSWPMITARNYGKGRVVYIAANLGLHYASQWTYPFVRRLQTNSVRWAAGANEPFVQIETLLQVHATLFHQRNPDRLIVHLLNSPSPQGYPPMTRQSWAGYKAAVDHADVDPSSLRDVYFTSFGRMREELAPVHNIRVRIRGEFKRIYTAPDNVTLAPAVKDGWSEVVVGRLDAHLMVVAE